jgi:hypothetical protein
MNARAAPASNVASEVLMRSAVLHAVLPFLALACCGKGPDAAGPSVSPAPAPAPKGKGPVTSADLLGRHQVRATGGEDRSFLWEFTADRFTIAQDGTKPIPRELIADVVPGAAGATRIEGTWRLEHEGAALVLEDLRVTGAAYDGKTRAAMSPYRTPVVRFDIGDFQYVVGPAPR